MRQLAVFAVILAFSAHVQAELLKPRARPEQDSTWATVINPWAIEVGTVGTFPERIDGVRVHQVLADDQVIVRTIASPPDVGRVYLLVDGVSTSGLVDGRDVFYDGWFKVTGTRKFASGRTIFVMRPENKAETEAREKAEAAKVEHERKELERFQRMDREEKAKREAVRREKAEERELARMAPIRKMVDRSMALRVKSAEAHLRYAKKMIVTEHFDEAKVRLREVVNKFHGTPAAKEAAELLKNLEVMR